jgi:hypothetical protein
MARATRAFIITFVYLIRIIIVARRLPNKTLSAVYSHSFSLSLSLLLLLSLSLFSP